MRPAALLLALLAAFAADAPAQVTGAIAGRVEVTVPPPIADRQPGVSQLGMKLARPQIDRRRSVVYLETAPKAAFEDSRERRARMDQRNETFVPHVLAITTGTTVDFPNNDYTFHNVFSLSPVRPFDLGRYAAGHSKSVTFDRPGIVRVFCDIHSHMSAFILVFSHRFFAVTDETGRYRIDDVPAGSYTVRAWNEAATGDARIVSVPASGGEVEANFALSKGPS